MNASIQKLLQDPTVARRLAAATSVAEAAHLLVEAAAARGWRLGREAVLQLIGADPAKPRELTPGELLAVGGGTRSRRTVARLPQVEGDADRSLG